MTDLGSALVKRYPAPEWALFFELTDDAGFKSRRRADAVAMNTWPSRGLEVHGFEMKQDRRDLLRELGNPAKSASIQRFCDRWWLVLAEGLLEPEDPIPITWGVLVLKGKKLVTEREAPKLTPEALTRGFVARILRSADEGKVPKATWHETVEKAIADRREVDRSYDQRQITNLGSQLRDLQERVRRFQEASGIELSTYSHDATKLGRAVRLLLDGAIDPKRLEWARDNVAQLASHMTEALEALQSKPILGHGKGEAAE